MQFLERLYMVSNILLRMVHIEMLSAFQTNEVLDFVRSFNKFEFSEWDQIWFEEGSVPLFMHRSWIDGLVQWLYSRGISPNQFLKNMMEHFEKSEAIPSRPLLRSYLPYVSQFYATKDARRLCLECLPLRQSFLNQARLISGKETKTDRTDFVIMSCKDEECLATNYMPWINMVIRYSPIFLNLPAYENVQLCASQNSAMMSLDGRAIADINSEKKITVNGEVVGKIVKFNECLERYGIPWENPYEKELECVHIEKDVLDSKTGNVLLYKDCYYGTPANVTMVNYKTGITIQDPFAKLMASVVRQEFDVWKPIQKAHENLLGALNDSVTVIYYNSDDSIAVNSKHLMRNVPARILRKILREYSQTGREEYENREFKRDADICMDPLRPNFESRLNRVVTHLEKVSNFFEIDRHRRGGFRFVPKCQINFKEE